MRAFALFIVASLTATSVMASGKPFVHIPPALGKFVAFPVTNAEQCVSVGGCFKYQIPGKPNRVSSKQDVMFCKAHTEPSSQPLNETNMSHCLLNMSRQRGEPVTNVFYDVED